MGSMTGVATALIGGLIALVIGVSLVPTIANESQVAAGNANVTGASNALVKLTPVIFVAGLILAGLAFMKFRS